MAFGLKQRNKWQTLGIAYRAEENIASDRFSLIVFIFALLSVLIQSSLILASSGKLPPEVPLFYSKPWGQPMLVSSSVLWVLPTVVLVSSILNFSLSIFRLKEDKFLIRILLSCNFIVALGMLYALLKVISLLI